MASVQFTFVSAMQGLAPVYGGQPRGETESGGGATTLALGNNEICRAKAITGDSYVRLGGSGTATASNGFHISEGEVIDMTGGPGDVARQDDA